MLGPNPGVWPGASARTPAEGFDGSGPRVHEIWVDEDPGLDLTAALRASVFGSSRPDPISVPCCRDPSGAAGDDGEDSRGCRVRPTSHRSEGERSPRGLDGYPQGHGHQEIGPSARIEGVHRDRESSPGRTRPRILTPHASSIAAFECRSWVDDLVVDLRTEPARSRFQLNAEKSRLRVLDLGRSANSGPRRRFDLPR